MSAQLVEIAQESQRCRDKDVEIVQLRRSLKDAETSRPELDDPGTSFANQHLHYGEKVGLVDYNSGSSFSLILVRPLQLLQSNPFLTPLACNLAALSMGLPPPQANHGASPPLAALFPGFNFAAAPPAGQDQAAPEPQRAGPAQGGPFVGLFQAPAGAGGQAGGFGENRAL